MPKKISEKYARSQSAHLEELCDKRIGKTGAFKREATRLPSQCSVRRKEEVQQGAFRKSKRCAAYVLKELEFKHTFIDARTNQVVQDEAVGKDATADLKRLESGQANSDQKRSVIERSQVNAVKSDALNGATADGVDKCRPHVRKKYDAGPIAQLNRVQVVVVK